MADVPGRAFGFGLDRATARPGIVVDEGAQEAEHVPLAAGDLGMLLGGHRFAAAQRAQNSELN